LRTAAARAALQGNGDWAIHCPPRRDHEAGRHRQRLGSADRPPAAPRGPNNATTPRPAPAVTAGPVGVEGAFHALGAATVAQVNLPVAVLETANSLRWCRRLLPRRAAADTFRGSPALAMAETAAGRAEVAGRDTHISRREEAGVKADNTS